MAEQKAGEMPFLDHLEELRWRLIYSLAALVVCVGVAFVIVWKFDALALLQRPITPFMNGHKLVYMHPADTFTIVMSTSITLGIVFALPVILYNLWAFLSPALHQREKRLAVPVFAGATLLFLAGAALAWFMVLPMSLGFLMGFQSASLEPMIAATEYFDFATTMVVTFGLAFELPIVIVALAALNLVSPQFLMKFRRHAVVLATAVAAIITPGDFLGTTLALAVPLYLLYEVSIWLTLIIFRKRAKAAREAEREAALA
ncbi:MAG: Sec-independent protein translocase, TatC subunit [Gemmatimonadetes bacterium]|nr:Sec-independent protein translocase, TatC subunit [Gemmatimonadota bacterium]